MTGSLGLDLDSRCAGPAYTLGIELGTYVTFDNTYPDPFF